MCSTFTFEERKSLIDLMDSNRAGIGEKNEGKRRQAWHEIITRLWLAYPRHKEQSKTQIVRHCRHLVSTYAAEPPGKMEHFASRGKSYVNPPLGSAVVTATALLKNPRTRAQTSDNSSVAVTPDDVQPVHHASLSERPQSRDSAIQDIDSAERDINSAEQGSHWALQASNSSLKASRNTQQPINRNSEDIKVSRLATPSMQSVSDPYFLDDNEVKGKLLIILEKAHHLAGTYSKFLYCNKMNNTAFQLAGFDEQLHVGTYPRMLAAICQLLFDRVFGKKPDYYNDEALGQDLATCFRQDDEAEVKATVQAMQLAHLRKESFWNSDIPDKAEELAFELDEALNRLFSTKPSFSVAAQPHDQTQSPEPGTADFTHQLRAQVIMTIVLAIKLRTHLRLKELAGEKLKISLPVRGDKFDGTTMENGGSEDIAEETQVSIALTPCVTKKWENQTPEQAEIYVSEMVLARASVHAQGSVRSTGDMFSQKN